MYAYKPRTAICAQMVMALTLAVTDGCAAATATASRHHVSSTRMCSGMSSLPTGVPVHCVESG